VSDAALPGWIALIAQGEACPALVAAMQGAQIEHVLLDSAAGLAELESADGLCAIVVSTREGAYSATAAVEASALERLAHVPVVLVCETIKPWQLRSALSSGICGVLLHEDLERALSVCLRAVCAGQMCVPRSNWRQVEPPALSAREKQILGLVVMGYMNSQIARTLFVAESTVKSHLSSAFAKLGVRSRNEAVDLIVNPDRGLGMGILGLGGEPVQPISSTPT
jgi:DNA-binding NarL/FixJ family response regulator